MSPMKTDDEVLYGTESDVEAVEDDDDYDDNDPQNSLDVWDEMREEGAVKARELLGLEQPKSNVTDGEVDFVLAYLNYCASAYILEGGVNYDHDVALHDLNMLQAAACVVRDKIEKAMKAGAVVKTNPPAKIVDLDKETVLSEEEQWMEWYGGGMGTISDNKKAEAITIGKGKGDQSG